eukprot:CAMPEP_0174728388 /NCGR_PEP_ID=MMETSP1094-20130205/51655_1 /TAXON_ID=156173 /ORGANISM="Chrysochromulina brevifilum, Strain UTEX LB 985" /LENGTH=31 /DNA_ID= /DNA_START= /DNA_END= /DNA_ORIENTATION=
MAVAPSARSPPRSAAGVAAGPIPLVLPPPAA